MMTMSQLAAKYIEARLAQREFGPLTAKAVHVSLRLFAVHVGDLPVRSLRREHVEEWLAACGRLAPSTVRLRLSQLRVLFRWAIEHEVMRVDPTLGVRGPRQPLDVPRNMRLVEVARLFAACRDLREELIVSLMVQEGLRRKEVAGLQLGDIDLDERAMKVVGKGGHERVLWITDETLELMQLYRSETGAVAGALVRSKKDARSGIGPANVSRIVAELMRLAKVKRFPYDGRSAHALRHTALTDMVRAGAHLRDVQQVAGHRSLRSTERYLAWEIKGKRHAMRGRRYRRRGGDTAGVGPAA